MGRTNIPIEQKCLTDGVIRDERAKPWGCVFERWRPPSTRSKLWLPVRSPLVLFFAIFQPFLVFWKTHRCPLITVHYRKPALCRVPEALPSVFYRALGKDGLCRVPNKIHSAKKNTRQNASLPSAFFLALWHSANMYFAECYFSTHGKIRLCRVPFFWHSAKMYFAECYFSGTRQNASLPSAFFLALGKEIFCRVPLFWHSAKRHFAVCIFFCPRQIIFFKAIFEALNEFKWKTFQLQSCITSQDLQSLFWSFLHLTKWQ